MCIRDSDVSALSFDATDKAGILEIVTTNSGEIVVMSGGLDVTTNITASADLEIEGDIDMATGTKITWVEENQWINGDATSIDIDGNDEVTIFADTHFDIQSPVIRLYEQATYVNLHDNNAGALNFRTDLDGILKIVTTDGSEKVSMAGAVDATNGLTVSGAALTITNQDITQATGGQVTFAGNVDANGGLDVTGDAGISGDLTLSAGSDGSITFSFAGENSITVPNSQASALIIEQANDA